MALEKVFIGLFTVNVGFDLFRKPRLTHAAHKDMLSVILPCEGLKQGVGVCTIYKNT